MLPIGGGGRGGGGDGGAGGGSASYNIKQIILHKGLRYYSTKLLYLENSLVGVCAYTELILP